MTVVRPSASMTTVVPRSSPPTGTAVTVEPFGASSSTATAPSRPGNGPTRWAGASRVSAARHTLTALPPGVTAASVGPQHLAGVSAASRIVRSIVWLRPTTNIDATSPFPIVTLLTSMSDSDIDVKSVHPLCEEGFV